MNLFKLGLDHDIDIVMSYSVQRLTLIHGH